MHSPLISRLFAKIVINFCQPTHPPIRQEFWRKKIEKKIEKKFLKKKLCRKKKCHDPFDHFTKKKKSQYYIYLSKHVTTGGVLCPFNGSFRQPVANDLPT
jgi:uncharacterized membrane-anchored protein YitT (DUF2179 family)